MASLVDTILSQHDRMQFYRSGDIANWGWGRQEYWRQIPKPRPGPWPGVQPDSGDDLRDTEGPEFRPHGGGSRDDDDDDQGDDDDDEDANEERDTAISAIRHVAQDLHREHGGRLRFNRILGYGGFGVVGLFDVLDQWGNRVEQVVIKARKEGSNSAMFLAEIRWHQAFRGALHIAQPRPFGNTTTDTILALEHIQLGDLWGMLCGIRARGNVSDIPDLVLWAFFKCLLKAIIAMAYPPCLQPGFREGELYEERIGNGEPQKFIHFDIDPRNIMIDRYGVADHGPLPMLKLIDFGMMLDLNDPTIRHNPESMAEMRSRGKVHWHTPEQFSSEWEYHYPLPVDAAVAGNYSWKTNLWQMAQVMWCLITQYQPPVGPIPRRFAGRWTYGYALVDEDDNYGSVSRSLRETVTHCMMDDPAHRPALDQLLLVIQSNLDLESTRPGASEAAAAWCAQNIGPGGPPPPPPPMRLAQALEDFLAEQLDEDEERAFAFGR